MYFYKFPYLNISSGEVFPKFVEKSIPSGLHLFGIKNMKGIQKV